MKDLPVTSTLDVVGAGSCSDLYLFFQYFRNRALQKSALVIWPAPRPPLSRVSLGRRRAGDRDLLQAAILKLHPTQVFGETMMLVYYVYAMPLSQKIRRGALRRRDLDRTPASCRTRRSAG